jgi:hypothetical protein
MWSTLPSNLRTVLGVALFLGIGVAAAAFTLSFFALRDAASDPMLQFGDGHAWLFPIGIDMALIFFEILLIGASMVRVQERGQLVPYPRTVPFLLVVLSAAATLYFNGTRVPPQARPIALAVPVASILVTLGLAYLLKMLVRVSGADHVFEAPVASDPRKLVRSSDVVDGELVRADSTSVTRSSNGQNGHEVSGGEGTKIAAIQAVAAHLGPEEVTEIGAEGVAQYLATHHNVHTSPGYVRKVLEGRAGSSRNGHGKA